jgi:hypothetical protein
VAPPCSGEFQVPSAKIAIRFIHPPCCVYFLTDLLLASIDKIIVVAIELKRGCIQYVVFAINLYLKFGFLIYELVSKSVD